MHNLTAQMPGRNAEGAATDPRTETTTNTYGGGTSVVVPVVHAKRMAFILGMLEELEEREQYSSVVLDCTHDMHASTQRSWGLHEERQKEEEGREGEREATSAECRIPVPCRANPVRTVVRLLEGEEVSSVFEGQPVAKGETSVSTPGFEWMVPLVETLNVANFLQTHELIDSMCSFLASKIRSQCRYNAPKRFCPHAAATVLKPRRSQQF